ncbi:MAG TPA: hypothetical protein VKD72_26060, partial [Gemmataceae bacterium]|nr:hypothetical protein [Gemmataceae bacterium]
MGKLKLDATSQLRPPETSLEAETELRQTRNYRRNHSPFGQNEARASKTSKIGCVATPLNAHRERMGIRVVSIEYQVLP